MIEERPLFFVILSLVLGEVCGQYANLMVSIGSNGVVLGFFCFFVGKVLLQNKKKPNKRNLYQKKRQRIPKVLLSFLCLSFFVGEIHSIYVKNVFCIPEQFENGEVLYVIGTVVQKSKSDYGITYRLQRPMIQNKQKKEERKSERISLKGDLLVYGLSEEVELGERVFLDGEWKAFREPTNPGQFHQKKYQMGRGVLGTIREAHLHKSWKQKIKLLEGIWRLREKINQGYQDILDEKSAGLLMAMVTGEKSLVDDEIQALYQEQGIAHILAISGLHVAFIGRSIFRTLRKRGVPYGISGVCGILLILVYGMFVGKTASVTRACIMLVLLLIGEVIGRSYDMVTAMGIAASLLVIENPYCIQDIGFLLSFGAIVGIGICYPYYFSSTSIVGNKEKETKEQQKIVRKKIAKRNPFIKEKLKKRTGEIILYDTRKKSIVKKIKESILVSLSIQMVTLPVLLSTFYGISPYSIFLNLWVLPMMSFLLPSAIFGGIMSVYSLFWAKVLLFPAVFVLYSYEALCRLMKLIPYSFVITGAPSIRFYVCYYILLVLGGYLWYQKKRRGLGVLLCISILVIGVDWKGEVLSRFPNSNYIRKQEQLEIICMDVGQGDGILVTTPSKHHYLIDSGSSSVQNVGTYRVLPLLKYYGISTLDSVVVTHFDSDHYNGIVEIMDSITIKKLLLPKLKEKDEEYIQFEQLAKEKEIPVFYVGEGDRLEEEEVTLQWLSPSRTNQKEDKNDNSQVFILSYRRFQGIFTGDMGKEGEQEMLEKLTPCTFLKVGHHGSKYSSSEVFLEQIQPKYSVISYGVGNRYGHPTKETLERLETIGTNIYETGKQGAIFIQTDGKKIKTYGYR